MRPVKPHSQQGVTLLELTIAVAVLTIMLGAAAQVLVSFYVAQDMQNQRNAVTQNLRGVLSDMRAVRDANPTNFPGAIVAAWPDGAVVQNAGTELNEQIRVTYADTTANPLEITVTSTWSDLRGRPLSMTMTTLLTDR